MKGFGETTLSGHICEFKDAGWSHGCHAVGIPSNYKFGNNYT